MSIEEAKKLVEHDLVGQGSNIDIGGVLPKLFNAILDKIEETSELSIKVDENTELNGFLVPKMSVNDVTKAFNAFVSGRPVTITDADDVFHIAVVQADNIEGEISITILFWNIMLVTYTLFNGEVQMTFHKF